MVRSVLLVDDQVNDYRNLVEEFEKAGIRVHCFTSREEAEGFLKSGQRVDLVILDWYLDGENDTDSLLLLRKLRDCFFVPVLMWTGVGNPLGIIQESRVFPISLVSYHNKNDFTPEKLMAAVKKLFEENLPGKVAREWRRVASAAIEKTLYALSECSNSNTLAAVKGLEDDDSDVSHPISVLHQLLLRHVSQDEQWCTVLALATQGRNAAKPTENQEEYGRLVHLQRYYERKPAINIRTCDVVQIKPEGWSGEPFYGVVITPSCDLAQKKTHYLRVAIMRNEAEVYPPKANDGTRGGAAHDRQWLPYIMAEARSKWAHYFCNFHDVVTLQRAADGERWAHKKIEPLRYEDTYILAGQTALVCRIEHVLTVDEPYQSALLNRFSAHAGRIGTPDVDRSVD